MVTGASAGRTVLELWRMLGFDTDRIHWLGPTVPAKAVVFSCRAPLIHPWLSLRTLEAFGIQHDSVPLANRKTVRETGESPCTGMCAYTMSFRLTYFLP